MKVMHVLNSRIYSGAEKVVCQIIKSFRGDVEMVYCSPDSDIVRQMLAEQDVTFLPMETMSRKELSRVIAQEKPDLIHAHDMRASFFSALCCGKIPLVSHVHNNAYNARGLTPKTVAYLLAGFKAKHILWVSNSSFEGYAFHKLFAKKSSVLYNIIDIEQIFEKKAADGVSATAEELRKLKPMPVMAMVASVGSNDPAEMYNYLGGVKNDRRSDELDAMFKEEKSNFHIVIVVSEIDSTLCGNL